MGIEFLEQKFQRYISICPHNQEYLRATALRVSRIQTEMRILLDDITQQWCPMCKAPCCQCLPVDGWFTECDYFLFRMLYPAPVDLRAVGHDGKSCFFLGERGCRLPSDMRPFPCVKVNCKNVIAELRRYGRLDAFTALNNELEQLQDKVYPLLADIVSYTVFQAQNYEPPVST